jgi:membrane dipeptidase
MENASPLVKDPGLLGFYQGEGRLLSLVHFVNNELADSSTDPKGPEWHGISPAGKALMMEAVKRGIVIDQSHASDEVFDQMVELLPVPFIASHSGAKAVYAHPRNLDDARLRKLAAKGAWCRSIRTRAT